VFLPVLSSQPVVSTLPQQRLAYPIKEAASIAGITAWTLYTAISEGRLAARKLGKAWIILHDDLANFLQNLDSASPATAWLEKRKSKKAAA
jgi:excisionase family DNA binding protein